MRMERRLEELIDQLRLEPHPEGGWFRETWRGVAPPGGRSVGTAIYFAVAWDAPSRLHRVDAAELFHWYGGYEAEQLVIDGAVATVRRIGPDVAGGAEPQAIVPAGAWQGLRVPETDGWALLGCTVAPGFEFDGFELATEQQVEDLAAAHPEHRPLIDALS
jgi:predicted cupin superfamily sugar epimerase